MKTLCVAVVVLSLTSVCQSAPLTCEELLKPFVPSPDLAGRWYLIALSSEYCVLPVVLNLYKPSIVVDIIPQDTPNNYAVNLTFHAYEYCSSLVKPIPPVNCSHCGVDSNDDVTHWPKRLLYTNCPDCLFLKSKKDVYEYILLSRRKTVTDAELKEFEALSECLGWAKPEVLNTDHEHLNCTSFDLSDKEMESVLWAKLVQRIQSSPTTLVPSHCIDRDDYIHLPAGMEVYQEAYKQLLKLQQH